MNWDGRDQAGRPVPAGAYHYTLVATTDSGDSVEHDLTGRRRDHAQQGLQGRGLA
ncbi:MAG: hypothetical protein ACPG2Z_05305 [Acidimicrobiales bacterium]